MLTAISTVSDRLVAALAPRETASAACPVVDSWCDGGCPFWWWRRKYARLCPDGKIHYTFSECGSGNC
ncbi:hypothetical protein ACFXG1_26625 [Streptomyces sp. NPDC059248]|uniref:hypothetical protein n=1 Tax=Streptomyces sp. NPDC059248 TaxID=3346791 RepID=UPI00369A4535